MFDGDVAFTKGGIWSRFLVIEEWANPAPVLPYETGTIVQHNGEAYIALSTPGAADEPGTAAVWKLLTGSGSGAAITQGTADPTGGSDGDAYLQVDASDEVESIWLNESGTWEEYTIPTAGTSTDDQTAAEVNTDTANFGGHLSGTDTTVQAALDTLDDIASGGDITAVGTTAPLTGGGTAGDVTIAIRAASPTQSGSMSAADKTKLDGVAANATANDGDVTSVTVSAPLTGGGNSGDLTIALPDATTAAAGAMSSADKTKLDGVAANATANTGDITEVGTTAPLTGGGTAGSVTIAIRAATSTLSGSMSALDKAKLDGLERQIELIDSLNDVTYTQADTANLSSRFGGATVYTAELDADGTADAEINDLIVFQWRDNPAGIPSDRPLGVRINDTALTLPIRIIDPLTNSLTNKTAADLTRYEFLFLSRQDGVFIQLSTLALNAVMQRILPANPTDDQIARYDSGTSAWVAEDLPAGGGTTFIGDTDTPTAYTGFGGYLNRVNAGEAAIEFIPEPANDNTIPHVSRLPTVADDSPVLVFLTHDEIDGNREDATLTVGEALGRYCGYSNGDIFQAFGAISKPSPIEMIFGIWDGTDCTIQTVHSANEGFIDDIRSVIFTVGGGTETTCALGSAFQEYGYETKRILSCPGLEDIATGDVTINFLYSDGTSAYWTDGSRAHRAGLYEKTGTPPVYHDLAPPEDAHKTGEGSAACGDTEPPDAAGQICVTSDGRGYFAMPRTELETTPATITVAASGSDLFIPDLYEPSDLQNRVGLTDGQFIYVKTSQDFYQFQDPDFVVVSWTEAWQYIIDNVADTAVRQGFLASVFLGEFASEAEVTRDRDGYSTPLPAVGTATITGGVVTAISIDYGGSGYTTAPTITIGAPGGSGTQALATATITDGVVTAVTITDGGTLYTAAPVVTFSDPPGVIDYYFLYSDFGTLIHISAFTNSVNTDIDAGFAWRGPVIIPEEVLDVVMANDTEEIDGVLDNILIGSQRYSVIVRPGENGQLRDAIAADYDTNYARSKVVAVVDGQPYKVRRTLVDGHTATGTFTEVAVNTRLSAGGSGTYRWRGVYTADQNVSHPEEDDIYYNIQYHHWRVRDHDDVYGDYWVTLPNGGEILARLNWVDYFTSEADALGHATANGQRFVLPDGSDWALYTLSAFTAALPAHYEYSWTEAVPVPVLPENEALVDDLEVTFNAADRPSIEVHFSRELLEADDGRPIIIDYRPNASGGNNRATGGAILAEHVRHLTTLRPVALQKDPPGGRNPIDHTEDLPTGANQRSPGHVEFPFPLSSGDNDLRWMRLIYIGDHIDDMDGAFGAGATTITVDNTAGFVVDRNYWIVGPISGGGCTPTHHSEKVTVTAIGTPNADDLTVVRGLDGTGLANNCQWVSGADIIEDDKTTFILAATQDDQDSGNFTFTLLSQGVGGQTEQAGGGSGGFGTTDVAALASALTTTSGDWTATGLTLPEHADGRWIAVRIDKSAEMLFRTAAYNAATAAAAGDDPAEGEVWSRSFQRMAGATLSFVELGVTAARELLVHTLATNGADQSATIPSLSIRQVD